MTLYCARCPAHAPKTAVFTHESQKRVFAYSQGRCLLRPSEVDKGSGARMSVRPGYKQTEAGIFPEDWEIDRLDRYWNVTDCKHVTAQFVSDGYPLASIKETQSRFVDLTAAKQTTQRFYDLLIEGGRKPQIGDLIISRNATVGEVAQVAGWHPLFAMGQDVCLIRKRQKEFSSDYLQSVFRSNLIEKQLSDSMVGSTFKRINVQQIKGFKVPMPSPPEQSAIAEALSDVDVLLTKLDQLIAKKRDLKQAVMQRLLTGQTRLPGFSEEWEVKTFGEVFDYLPTATNARNDLSDSGDTYYVHYGDIHTKFHSHLNFYNQRPLMILKELCENAAYLKNGDWVMADASEDYDGVGKAIEISGLEDGVAAVAGLHTFLLREKIKTFAEGFKGHLGNLNSLHQQYLRVATGMKVFGVSKAALKNLVLNIPSMDEQAAITAILSDMDAELATLVNRRDKAAKLKQGMMQELLTGRIRLI